LEEEVKAIINEEIIVSKKMAEIIYPIYDKHFTIEDLNKMIELNNTPFGQKMIRIMPLVAQESMQAGQVFGRSLGPIIQKRIADRFKKEGIK